jgi:hypothetical protein
MEWFVGVSGSRKLQEWGGVSEKQSAGAFQQSEMG